MKKMVCLITLTAVFFSGIFVQARAGELSTCEKNRMQKKAIEDIAVVQFNTLKANRSNFGEQRLRKILRLLEETVNEKNLRSKVERKGDYDTFLLIHQNQEKDKYCFFQEDDEWYVQTEDGNIYCDAEFILDFFDIEPSDTDGDGFYNPAVVMPEETESTESVEIRNWGKQFQTFDLNYYFGYYVFKNMENGLHEEQALEAAYGTLEDGLKLYEYAEQNREQGKDEEPDDTQSETDESSKISEYVHAKSIIDELYKKKYNDFRNGEDTVNGVVCWSFTEYWNSFLLEIVFPEMDEREGEAIEEKLGSAQTFYEKHKND